MKQLTFITAVPLNVRSGSGCYVGTTTLVRGIQELGVAVEIITPRIRLRPFTARRLAFNEALRWRSFRTDATIGIDADGYAIAGRRNSPPHVACIKGVLGDAVRFEAGTTRASVAFQARLEAQHAQRADLVITISRYCADRLEELYGVRNAVMVPELIDLPFWRSLFHANPFAPDPEKFTVLSVCRFYPRKRLDILLRAAARLRGAIPGLEVRIVGDGPERQRLHRLCIELGVGAIVRWLGDLPVSALATEYNRADVFCLPSVQEGFGIVFLEAMAAGKAIVASRAAAVPEVVRSGILVEPDDPKALADGLIALYRDERLRSSLGAAGARDVERFEMTRIAQKFLSEIAVVTPGIKPSEEQRVCKPA
ncbi:MAG TPA: glycosyltransferase family 4 protein [Bryobacteraceae bacterium]|nr:glycosyltransferase family 4 protein [Bryobacteraceae bacterium]